MMRLSPILAATIALFCASKTVCAQQSAPDAEIVPGKVLQKIIVARIPDQSYALYLPQNYTEKKQWPIIYAFDPNARGAMPVEMLKEAAEKFGYIVVGSNNSRNGPGKMGFDAMQAMWGDTHQRFSIDDKRIYLTGFSGGARVATMIAKACGCAAGIIGHGAGFMREFPPDKDIKYSYFVAIGLRDYNFYEIFQLQQTLEKLGVVHRVRRYDGTHQWATPEVWMEAVEWMEVRAMQEKRKAADAAFIADYAKRRVDQAAAAAEAGDASTAFDEYAHLAEDLAGLTDTSAFAAKAKEMENSPALVSAQKKDERDIRDQAELIGSLYADLDQLRDNPAARAEAEQRLRLLLRNLAQQYESKKDTPEGLVVGRSLNQASSGVYSVAEAALFHDSGKPLALICFEILTEGFPKAPIPFYRVARLAAELGDKKRSIRSMKRAIENGLPDEALHRFQKDFASVAADKDFQKLLANRKPAAS